MFATPVHGQRRRRTIDRFATSAGILLCAALGTANAAEDCAAEASRSATALVRAADCLRSIGDPRGALAALEMASAAADAETQAFAILARQGQLYLERGDYGSARDRLTRALDPGVVAPAPGDVATALNDLGTAHMALDEPLLGLTAFADARRLATEGSPLAAIAALNVVRALAQTGTRDDLSAQLESATAAARRLEPSATRATIILGIAALYRTAAGPERSAVRAAELAQEALAFAETYGDADLLAEAHGQIGLARAAGGDLDEALAATRRAVASAQSAAANGSLYRWEWETGRLLRAMGKNDDALVSYEAAIDTLSSTQVAAVQSRGGFVRSILPVYEEYADLMLTSSRGLPPGPAEAALTKVQRALELLKVSEVRNYFENQCSVPELFDSRRALPADVVVIYPLVLRDRVEILVSTGDRLLQFTVAVGESQITSAARSLRRSIEDASSGDAYLQSAQRLYRWLIAPLEPVLAEIMPATLIVVPNGPLRTVPFAALHDGTRFLVERYTLGTTPALSLVGTVTAQPISRVLVNGIIEPTQGFSGLPFVAQELENIGATFPSRIYSDDEFVTSTLEREMVEGGYSVVHMATHAQFESDYRRSFLVAHDGLITMDNLEDAVGGQRFSNRPVDLLVLSACRTAAGDERAALGLAGVAVKAGARSALASLWAVNDESTATLISEFYRQLAAGGGKAAALRGAQLALINDARFSHPAYWAPFLMIGDWR